MSAKRNAFKVRRNNGHLSVYPWTHPTSGAARWRYNWRENESSPWRTVTCRTRGEAETSAWEKLGQLDMGGLVWSGLDPDARRFLEEVHRAATPADRAAVLAFIQARRKSSEVVASVARFMAGKVAAKGEETPHVGNLRRELEAMAEAFKGRVLIDISPDDLRTWWETRTAGLGDKSSNDVRSTLVSFWRWATVDGIYPKEVSPAEKLPRVENLGIAERRILSPAEFLHLAREVAEEWRPWIVLGAFCGLRPEEIAPPQKSGSKKASKRGLRCEEIDFQFRCIHLPAEVSKTAAPRHVPLSDAAIAWLEWAGIREGMQGAVCHRNPAERGETKRLGVDVFKTGWPQDALRHSYGSFRNAILRNLPQVAEEMGTSETMLRKHYHNPRHAAEGNAWFAIRPDMIRFDPISKGSGSVSEPPRKISGL